MVSGGDLDDVTRPTATMLIPQGPRGKSRASPPTPPAQLRAARAVQSQHDELAVPPTDRNTILWISPFTEDTPKLSINDSWQARAVRRQVLAENYKEGGLPRTSTGAVPIPWLARQRHCLGVWRAAGLGIT